jgi:NAD(P)-dependent dehydrogenase (short-subunit alcohol dehydrogenase family)
MTHSITQSSEAAQPLIAVVTGAGQGIGRAVALKLAAHGAHIVLVGRTQAKLDAVAAEVIAAGGSATVVEADVTQAGEVQRVMDTAAAVAPHLDALVNCVGEAFIATLDDTTEADFDRLLTANLKTAYLTSRAALPLLRQSANASVVNVVSKVALANHGTVTAYTAAKAGLLGFTHSLSDELKPEEIRAVAICPGAVDTPMRWAATPDYERRMVIDPVQVADLAWYVITLPRGATTGDLVVTSMYYD